MILAHPDFPDLTRSVSAEAAERWQAAGWVSLEVLHPCPTCGAVRDEPCISASGNETTRHFARTT